jgi:RNA-binding protein 25
MLLLLLLIVTEDRTATLKALMDSIPTAAAPLFAHAVAWDSVDATFVEKRIQPWVTRKITEYLGEEEKTLVAFVCSKIAAKAKPQYVSLTRCSSLPRAFFFWLVAYFCRVILEEIKMVLEEEAEPFVLKLWRLLVYEAEARKRNLTSY